jgi:adenine-specific DNA-methyltransferase
MQTKAKEKIKKLIEKYEGLSELEKRKYNEQQTKDHFIRPLFEALGWDFESEVWSEKDVLGKKRVDYAFVLNGINKFLVEAKPLKVDLEIEIHAKQAINYAWNKGVNWAVLTDFEGIKVFNAQGQSRLLIDKLVFDIPYAEYLTDFDRLWLLSKESFKENKLEEYAIRHGKKLKKLTVNEKLFGDLKIAREKLTESLKRWNEGLSQELLEEGVQRVLDRLVFIRVLEDRGLEDSILRPLIREWDANHRGKQLFQMLIQKFRELDDIYNSSIFLKHTCEEWEEYDDTMKNVIDLLYGSSIYEYNFKEIPADILGGVYESYLGYIARNHIKAGKPKSGKLFETEGKQEIKEKSRQKRKEQGIYYTPKYIVDYIVQNTLGKKLAEIDNINDLKKIKVLDPACGSGSFLTAALKLINEKYKEFGNPGNQYTKSEILLNNIYGVDLDPQAVELAKLNLLIEALDQKAKLPDITSNIRVGNSLISGTEKELKQHFGKNWRDKKPFNWKEEFMDVFKQGGFDVIIGNPPYIKEFVNKSAFDGLHHSLYYQGKMDIWTMFACISIDLLKEGGALSFIAPNNWISNAGASIFRDKILKDGELKSFIDFGDYKVFEQAGIQTMIFVFKKKKPIKKYNVDYFRINDKNITEDKIISGLNKEKIKIIFKPEKLIGKNITFEESKVGLILDKIQKKKNFELIPKEIGQGIVAAPDKYFLEKNIESYNTNERAFLKNFYTASGRYESGESKNYIFYICDKNFHNKKMNDFPNIKNHFSPFEKILKEAKIKYGTPLKPYFYLHREREETFFTKGPKIICGVRVKYPSFYYTELSYYGSRALNFIKTDRINLKYLVGILNSKISFFWLKNKGKQLGDLLQIDKGPLLKIPIYVGSKAQQKSISFLVDRMLKLKEDLRETAENSNQWQKIKNEIAKTDKKIDEEIYKLYGLMPEEIKIIEENEREMIKN